MNNINEINQLAEQGFITDVTLIREIINNPELAKTINIGEFVSQVTAPVDIKEAEELFMNMVVNGDVVLNQPVLLSTPTIVEKELFVNLNNNTITGPLFAESNGKLVEGDTDSYVFWVKKGGKLTLNGEGTVKSQACKYSMAVWAQGGEVIINGGTYENAGEGSDLIYASAGAKIEINGGEFKACEKQEGVSGTNNLHSALNIKDSDKKTTSIVVKGGKFYGFDPANNVSENPKQSFVADGYESVEIEAGVFEVRKKVEVVEVVEPAKAVETPVEIVVEEKDTEKKA